MRLRPRLVVKELIQYASVLESKLLSRRVHLFTNKDGCVVHDLRPEVVDSIHQALLNLLERLVKVSLDALLNHCIVCAVALVEHVHTIDSLVSQLIDLKLYCLLLHQLTLNCSVDFLMKLDFAGFLFELIIAFKALHA